MIWSILKVIHVAVSWVWFARLFSMMTQQFVHKAGSYALSTVIHLWCSSPDNSSDRSTGISRTSSDILVWKHNRLSFIYLLGISASWSIPVTACCNKYSSTHIIKVKVLISSRAPIQTNGRLACACVCRIYGSVCSSFLTMDGGELKGGRFRLVKVILKLQQIEQCFVRWVVKVARTS